MLKFITVLTLVLLYLSACKKFDIAKTVPDCIRKEIENLKKNTGSGIAKVSEYYFQGQLVYCFEPDPYPDSGIGIVDSNCNSVCYLGGITGIVVCNGENFSEKAIFKRMIWNRK